MDFKNTIIIMTSNIGSQYLTDGITQDGAIREVARRQVMDELRAHCRPEFLNRVDEVVLFKPLTVAEIEQIVGLQTVQLQNRLKERDIDVVVTPRAAALLARQGYDPVYGARPLKRLIQRSLETRIGRALLAGDIPDHAVITVDSDGGDLQVRSERKEAQPEDDPSATGVVDDTATPPDDESPIEVSF